MAQMGQQGQQGQQGQGAQLQEREMLQLALNETKHMASAINTYILEATNEQLRRDYMSVLGDVYSNQKQVFDVMQQKGYYNVKNASPQDIAQAKNKFQQNAGQSQQQGQQGQQQMQ